MVMAVMLPRESCTDDRLDKFEKRVDKRFDAIEARFDRFEAEATLRLKQVDERFQQVDKRFEQIDKRLDRIEDQNSDLQIAIQRMHTTMTTGFIGMAGLFCTAVVFFQ